MTLTKQRGGDKMIIENTNTEAVFTDEDVKTLGEITACIHSLDRTERNNLKCFLRGALFQKQISSSHIISNDTNNDPPKKKGA